jgi:hypothetical protein
MKKKTISNLNLKKRVISDLNQLNHVRGGEESITISSMKCINTVLSLLTYCPEPEPQPEPTSYIPVCHSKFQDCPIF